MKIQQHAFTLVELSIVLVILGLLVGGVLTGQSLIRAAELRSIATQYSGYQTAVMTFRDKYFALPGDMTNAASYWGAADGAGLGNSAACFSTASTTATTCNGNGNGRIDSPSSSNEMFRFWQQLANAGLIEGSYDGIKHGAVNDNATKENSPSGKISSSLWWVYNFGTLTSAGSAFDGQYDNILATGGVMVNAIPGTPILKPEEMYNIDTKLDDGKPATGRMVIRTVSSVSACTDTSTTSNLGASYLLSGTALSCYPVFRQAF